MLIYSQPRTYRCDFTDTQVIIDGYLDDWEGVEWTEDFIDITGRQDLKPIYRSRAKMMWDTSNLYIAAEMEEPHLWGTITERDKVIYFDNDFEIFIDPDGDTHNYAEIEINTLGTVWDLFLTRPYRDGAVPLNSFDIHGLQYAVHLMGTVNDPSDTDTGWIVEMAIPWESLKDLTPGKRKPYPGEYWRINFSRVQWELQHNGQNYVKRDLPEDNWVWTAQGEVNMHMPEKWGYVFFSNDMIGDKDFIPPVPADDLIRQELRSLYHAQKTFRKERKQYALNLEELLRYGKISPQIALNCVINASLNQYEIRYTDIYENSWLINQSGRIWKEKPIKAWVWMHGDPSLSLEDWGDRFSKLKLHGIHGILMGGGWEIMALVAPLADDYELEIQAWTWILNCNNKDVINEHPAWYSVSREGHSCIEKQPYVSYYKWLCPSRMEVRHYLATKAEEIMTIDGLSGFHMDYIRHPDVILPVGLWDKYGLIQDHEMPEFDYCYCDVCRTAFKAKHGYDPLEISDPAADTNWRQYRYDMVTEVVKRINEVTDSMGKKLTAAVFPSPDIARKLVRQDWDKWPVDEIFPMMYHNFYNEDIAWIGEVTWQGVRAIPDPINLYSGLYVPALSPEELNIAIRTIVHSGAWGFCLFEYNALNDDHWRVVKKNMDYY